MKNTFIILTLFFCSYNYSQEINYPKGMYMNFNEIINKQPSKNYNIELEKRSVGKIKMNGGNDFQLNSVDKLVKRKVLKKQIYAYSDGNKLYLNCFKHKLQTWYSEILSDGNNFIFKASIPLQVEKYGYKLKELTKGEFIGFGGAFTGMKLAMLRFPYILNKSTEKVSLVTDKNIREFISSNKNLLKKYEKETNKNDLDVIMKYLIEWNKMNE
jgi:hypothetical protein